MWLVRAALRFRVTVAVAALVILVMATLSARQMRADVLPSIDIPVVVVVWGYPGLSAEDMERRIVLVSERAYSSTVSGIARIESRSTSGIGLLRIYFEPNANVAAAISQVSSISQTVTRLMPTGTLPPTVLQYSASNVPIAQLTVSSDTQTEQQLFDYGQNSLRVRLFTVPGLSTPLPYGGKARQVMVNIDPAALSARGIAPQDVVRALLDSNLTVPAGTARMGDLEYDVSINNSPSVVEEFNRIPLKFGAGPTVRLGDVAKVEDGFAVQQNIVHVDGKRATFLTVMKKNDASTIAVIDSARALLPQLRASAPPGIELKLDFDQSTFVRTATKAVLGEALVAAALVSILMLLFLGSWRSALLVATSIPLSVGGAIIGLKLAGQTINLMTVGGLALAIGLLVDDATVEVENIHRNRQLGKPLLVAIEDGAREVARPALAATLAICLVFGPVFGMDGAARFLFAPLAMAVIFAMLTSYVLSRTLVPALASVLLVKETVHRPGPGGHGASGFGSALFSFLGRVYVGILRGVLAHRVLAVVACVGALVAGGFAARGVGVEFFPEVDTGQMRLHVRAPIGTRIEKTEEIVSNIEGAIRGIIPPAELQTINDNIGVPNPLNLAFVQTDSIGSQDADIFIALRPGHRSTAAYRERIRDALARSFPETHAYFQPADIVSQALGFGSSAPIDVGVEGNDIERSAEIALRIRERMRQIPGVVDTRIAQVFDHPALQIDVDREQAARLGLAQKDVADNMLTSLSSSGLVTPSFWLSPQNGVNYLVAVQTPIHKVESIQSLMSTPITGVRAEASDPLALLGRKPPVYLGSIAALHASQSKALISHETIQRVVNVQASVEGRDLGSVSRAVDQVVATEKDLPPGTRIVVRGEAKAMFGAFQDLTWGLGLALLLVYFLLVVLFQSWIEPLVIMVAVPGALVGAVAILALTHTRFNVESFMGVIMSVGVAVSNSILLVNTASRLRLDPRLGVYGAAIEAGRTRLRPVLMTVLAMVGGMLPLAVGTAEGSEQNAPLARAVIGGLLLSTLVTLFVVPLFYAIVRGRRHEVTVIPADRRMSPPFAPLSLER